MRGLKEPQNSLVFVLGNLVTKGLRAPGSVWKTWGACRRQSPKSRFGSGCEGQAVQNLQLRQILFGSILLFIKWTDRLLNFDSFAVLELVEGIGLDRFSIYLQCFDGNYFPIAVAFCEDNPASFSAFGL
jgi:hypothetical protein